MSGPQDILIGDDKLTEKCAVFGTFGASKEAARLAYYGLWALQHRGQESSGIASADTKNIYDHSDFGLVANVYKDEDLSALHGHISIGHNRYSTSGGRDACYNQPFLNKDRTFAFAHNGNLPETVKLEKFLKKHKVATETLNDSGMMAAAIDVHMQDGSTLEDAVIKSYPLFQGVFSALAMGKDRLVAFRDEYGIRPLSIAELDGGYVVSSETCAYDTIGAKFIREIEPGELVVIDERGIQSYQVVKGNQKLDVFEFVYFARPDSTLMGRSVNKVRENFGIELAKEYPVNADIVVPVPDSSVPAALGYSRESGLRFEMALVKNRYINRTFIRPTEELRTRDLTMKLNPVIQALKGKRIVLVDDSIVRGTTMRKVVKMLRGVGVKEIHLMISSPPVKYPDFYGINTPNQNDLIAAKMSVEEIREHLGADSLGFLSFDGMIAATGLPASKFSSSCFNGVYPAPIGQRSDDISYVDSRPMITPNPAKKVKTKSKVLV
ncbi:amidophosphoribosyltransferase [Candidatus Saccharibacteria bacterium]|nr:amidophosphoribosyltransferase [Candidatus Saccharibacteria bacterium]